MGSIGPYKYDPEFVRGIAGVIGQVNGNKHLPNIDTVTCDDGSISLDFEVPPDDK